MQNKTNKYFASLFFVLAIGLGACSQSQQDVGIQTATDFDPTAFPTSVGPEPDGVRSIFQGGSVGARLCLFGLNPASGKVLAASRDDYTEVTIDSATLPKGVRATTFGRIPSGSACTFVSFSAASDATLGLANLGITAVTYTSGSASNTVTGTMQLDVKDPTPPAPTTGTLNIEIKGVPTGISLETGVTVTGPAGYSFTLKNPGISLIVAPGEYTLQTPPTEQKSDRSSSSIVTALFYNPTPATEQKVTVTAGGTSTLSVTYSRRPNTGYLWTTEIPSISGFDVGTLNGLGKVVTSPAVDIKVAEVRSATSDRILGSVAGIGIFRLPQNLSFASDGTMWFPMVPRGFAMPGFDLLKSGIGGLLPTGLVSALSKTADLEFDGVIGHLSFDRVGNVWALGTSSQSLSRFPAASLTGARPFTPDIVIKNVFSGGVVGPTGDLWVPKDNRLYRIPHTLVPGTYDANKLEGGITYLELKHTRAIGSFRDMAFDRAGNFWLTVRFGDWRNNIIRVPASALVFPGIAVRNVTDDVQLASPVAGGLGSLAFDNSGMLWTTALLATGAREIWQLDVGKLLPGVNTPDPLRRLGSTSISLTFYPTPCGLPLYGSQPC